MLRHFHIIRNFSVTFYNSLKVLTEIVMRAYSVFVNETSSLLSCVQQFPVFRVIPGHLVENHVTVNGSETKIFQGLLLFVFIRHHFLHVSVISSHRIIRDCYLLQCSVTLPDGGQCIRILVFTWLCKLELVACWVITVSVELLLCYTTVCRIATFYVFDHLRLLVVKNVNLLDQRIAQGMDLVLFPLFGRYFLRHQSLIVTLR